MQPGREPVIPWTSDWCRALTVPGVRLAGGKVSSQFSEGTEVRGLGLTSPALVVVLAVAAIAALAGTLWWWPRLAGPGPRSLLLRIAALAALQVSVLGLIFVIANRSAEFYSSWSDLFGTDSANGAIVAVGLGSSQTAAPLKVISSAPVPVPGRRRVPGGRLQTVQIHGQLSGLSAPGYVYLPPRYPRAAATAAPLGSHRGDIRPAGQPELGVQRGAAGGHRGGPDRRRPPQAGDHRYAPGPGRQSG